MESVSVFQPQPALKTPQHEHNDDLTASKSVMEMVRPVWRPLWFIYLVYFPVQCCKSELSKRKKKRVHAHGRVPVFECMLVLAGKGELQRVGCSFELLGLLGKRAV